jgi:hypothetical protein
LVNGFTSEDIESSFYKGLDAVHIKKAKARENDSPGLPGGGRTVSPGPEITLDSDLLWNKPKAELMGKKGVEWFENEGRSAESSSIEHICPPDINARVAANGMKRS